MCFQGATDLWFVADCELSMYENVIVFRNFNDSSVSVFVWLYIEILVVNTEESWTIVEAVAAHFYGLWCNYYDKWHYTLNWITARAQKHTSHTKHSVSGWVLNFAPAKSTLPNIPVESPLFFSFKRKFRLFFNARFICQMDENTQKTYLRILYWKFAFKIT